MNKIQLTKEQWAKIGAGCFSAPCSSTCAVYFWLPTAKKIEANSKQTASMESDIFKAKMQKAK